MKGILLAGGYGTRLFPVSKVINKHLLPIYDKPVIYYSLSTLMLCGIREVLIISGPKSLLEIENLLGDGSQFGMSLSYAIQSKPNGIPEAFTIAASFLGGDSATLALGDNILFGPTFGTYLQKDFNNKGCRIYLAETNQASNFGICEIDERNQISRIVEKPIGLENGLAIVGLYKFDNHCVEMTKKLEVSKRGELEIVDLLKMYLSKETLSYEIISRSNVWLDTGTFASLQEASEYVRIMQNRHSRLVGSPEEVALRNGWITTSEFESLISTYPENSYKSLLNQIRI